MIDSELIQGLGRDVPFDIWTIAYMRALHTEPSEEAALTADRAVERWFQHSLQRARDCVDGTDDS